MTGRFAILAVVSSVAYLGCSDFPELETRDRAKVELKEKAPVPQPAANPAADDANKRLSDVVKQARVHFEFSEFDVAEKLVTDALADSDATQKDGAIMFLRQVKKAAQRQGTLARRASPNNPAATSVASDRRLDSEREFQKNNSATAKPDAAEPTQNTRRKEIVVEIDEPREPAVPAEKPTATDQQVSALIRDAQSQSDPESALAILQAFSEVHSLTDEHQKRVDRQRDLFQERADQGLVRNGKEWIAKADAQQREAEADVKIQQALTLIDVRNIKAAVEFLEDASQTDRNGIRADFALGMIYSMYGFYQAEFAERHFQQVLLRSPDHVSALNNVALAELKQREFSAALGHWRKASQIAPNTHEVVHNLGRVISEASIGKVKMQPTLLRRFTKLYAEVATGGEAPQSDTRTGWLYMPLVLPEGERDRPAGDHDGKFVSARGWGTGFVVHENYIVTNKHVIHDDEFGACNRVTILDPADDARTRELEAHVVAEAKNLDLALLRCDGLNVPPLKIDSARPRRGTEVLVLGFPQGQSLGKGIKVTRGIVTGLPEAATGDLIVLDAEVNPGNSGGPICNDRGTVIGVVTVRWVEELVGDYSGGIPAKYLDAFLTQTIEDYKSLAIEDEEALLNWVAVDEAVSPSTVLITAQQQFPDGQESRQNSGQL